MKKLKILMLTRLFPSNTHPTMGTFCLDRARALAEHADVRVMVPVPYFPKWMPGRREWKLWSEVESERELECGIRVAYPRYALIPKVATFLQGYSIAHSAYRAYRARYAEWRPDVIDGHFAFPDGYAAVSLGRKIGVPAVVTCHGADLRVYPDLLGVKGMIEQTLAGAGRAIAVSRFLQRRCVELGCLEDKTVFLTNGVDPSKFVLRAKADCRAILGLPLDRKIGVYVGYLIDRKNQSVVVRALAEIRGQGRVPPLVVLVGDGPNRRKLEREVKELGLGDHVMLTGQRPHEEVALWMGAADWLLLSSNYEGWATVYFEAMACGRPVLTSNVSSATDAVCRPEYGTVVESCTPRAFAAAMIDAASRNYDPMVLRAYAEDHSWQRWAEQAMALFEQVIAEQGLAAGPDVHRSGVAADVASPR